MRVWRITGKGLRGLSQKRGGDEGLKEILHKKECSKEQEREGTAAGGGRENWLTICSLCRKGVRDQSSRNKYWEVNITILL